MSSSGRKNATLKRKKFSAVNQSHMLSKEGIKEYAISVGVEADYMLDKDYLKIWLPIFSKLYNSAGKVLI